MSSPIFVYEQATEIPAWVIDTLKRHNLNANIILPQIEKSRQNPPDAPQSWIVYAPNRKVEYILSVTESIVDSYPVFIFTTKKQSTLISLRPTADYYDVYDALIRRCTRQTFIKTQRQPVGYECDMRLAKTSDRRMVADLCKGFSL